MSMKRRVFLKTTGMAAGTALSRPLGAGAIKTYRAAVIGRTGGGNYGHGLDLAFQNLPNVTVVAVADEDPKGRDQAKVRTGALRTYSNWKEMLERENPDIISIGPRWVVDRFEMVHAAAEIGAHVYMEKPIAGSLQEADAMIAAAEKHRIKIAVALQVLLAPALVYLKKRLNEGLIGDLLEMRTRGKEDHRAGGEDLMVLGTHCMYLMRYFAGDASSCWARVTQRGREITHFDKRAATEPLGPVAGDSIHASYAFADGIQGYFASQSTRRGPGGRFEISLYGSKGIVRLHIDQDPAIYLLEDPLWSPGKTATAWRPLPGAPGNDDLSGLKGAAASNKRIVQDLLRAIETGSQPAAGIYEARAALEMILAVYASHLNGCRVRLPLEDRRHPLGRLD